VPARAAAARTTPLTAPVASAVRTRSGSLVGKALDAMLYATPALAGDGVSTPAIGIQTRTWLTTSDGPLQLGLYSERQTLSLNYMDHLSAQQLGLTASGHIMGARLFGGAGLERVHTRSFHPDRPSTRRIFSAPDDDYWNPAFAAPPGYYDIDYAPHLTAGAGYTIGDLEIGAGVSFGVYSSVSLIANIDLF
jgi:hypothetical protein